MLTKDELLLCMISQQIIEEINSIFGLWASLALQETHHVQQDTRHVHDSMNLPNNDFSFAYLNILFYQLRINFKISPNLAGFPDILN